MPLIGAHVSIAGGIVNAPTRAAAEGCECFQMFTRSPQGGAAPPITDAIAAEFRAACAAAKQRCWMVHTPYYINLASAKATLRKNSGRIIREELERASHIGALAVMTHLGSSREVGAERGRALVIEALADALHGYTGSARFCIEISAGAGATVGGTFEDIAMIIAGVESSMASSRAAESTSDDNCLSSRGTRRERRCRVIETAEPTPRAEGSRSPGKRGLSAPLRSARDDGRIGVCFDTQHAFASGYDLRTEKAVTKTLKEIDATIGLNRLVLSHIQDSKVALGEHKDRHEHIGHGHLGADGLRAFVRHPAIRTLPLILETEAEGRAEDLRLLKEFRG